MGGLDVAQHPAGTDGCQLLVVTDETDRAAPRDHEVDDGVQAEGVGHPRLVDDDQSGWADGLRPVGKRAQRGVRQVPGQLRHGVGGGLDVRAEDVCCGCGGGQPKNGPSGFGPGSGEGSHGCGLAGASGGDRQLEAGAGGGHLADQSGLAGVEGQPVCGGGEHGQIDGDGRRDHPVVLSGSSNDAGLGGQQVGGGEQLGAGDGVDAGAVAAAQGVRHLHGVAAAGERHRMRGEDLVDQQAHDAVHVGGVELDAAYLPQRLSLHVPALPVRAGGLQRVADSDRRGAHPGCVDAVRGAVGWVECRGDHRLHGAVPAEDLACLSGPCGALLGQRAGRVLGLAGLQGRLLCQLDRLDRRGRPTVRGLERLGQDAPACLDAGAAGGPALVQQRVHAADLADGPLARVGARPGLEADAEGTPQVMLQAGVVDLGGGHGCLEQDPSVDGQPLALAAGLDLVGHGDVRVQVGVAGAGIAVGEGGADQPAGLDLADALRAFTSKDGLVLQVVEGVVDRALVGTFDRGRDRLRGDRPQGADALHRREGQVIAGDRVRPGTRVPGDGRRDLAGVDRVPVKLLPEQLDRDLSADPGAVLKGAFGIPPQAAAHVRVRHSRGHTPAELRDVVGVHRVEVPEPARPVRSCRIQPGLGGRLPKLLGQWVAP